jgi:O-antigen/teichoic acid export membrane protein
MSGTSEPFPQTGLVIAEAGQQSPPGPEVATRAARRPAEGPRTRARVAVRIGLAGKAAELVTLALLVTLVPRLLGPHAYGRFALALAIVTLGSLSLSLAGSAVMNRFVPAAPPAERAAVARALAVRLARVRGAQLAVVAAAAAALAATMPHRFPALLTGLVGLALVLDLGAALASQVALGLGRPAVWAFRYPLQNALMVAAVLGLFSVAGSTGAVAGLAVASGLTFVVASALVIPQLLAAEGGAGPPRGALRFGALQALSGIFGLIQQRGGVIAVGLLGGSTVQQGYAGLAVGVGLAATYVVWQAFVVQLPALVERWSTDPAAAEEAARRLARDALIGAIAVAAVGALSLDYVVPVVFGESFRGAESAFRPALALLPLAPVAALAAQVSALWLRPAARVWTTATGLTTFVGIAALAVPAWGAAGATTALLGGRRSRRLSQCVSRCTRTTFGRPSAGWRKWASYSPGTSPEPESTLPSSRGHRSESTTLHRCRTQLFATPAAVSSGACCGAATSCT